MTVGIFYISLQSGAGRRPLPLPGLASNVFIRVEVVDCAGLEEALNLASPAEDESVMNTHPVTVEEWK
jgi:hypothetical protein